MADLSRIDNSDGDALWRITDQDYVLAAAGSALTNSTAETVLASTTIAADTLESGTTVHIRAFVVTSASNSTDTLTVRLRMGTTTLTGTALVSTAAIDQVNGDQCVIDFTVVCRADPSAASACVGFGMFSDPDAAGTAMKTASIAATNFATNGALLVEVTGEWSVANAGNSCAAQAMAVRIR